MCLLFDQCHQDCKKQLQKSNAQFIYQHTQKIYAFAQQFADDKHVDVRLSRRHRCLFLALLICQLTFSPLHMLLIMICQLCFSPLGMLLVMICPLSKPHVPLFVALRISLHSIKYVLHALILFCKIKSRLQSFGFLYLNFQCPYLKKRILTQNRIWYYRKRIKVL